jgi:hypothetical protein
MRRAMTSESGDCGPAANHYCSALIYIIRAKHTGNKNVRLVHFGRADVDVKYTERAIADYPKCSIREHVASTRAGTPTTS